MPACPRALSSRPPGPPGSLVWGPRSGPDRDLGTVAGPARPAEHVQSHVDLAPRELAGPTPDETQVALCPTCNHDAEIGARFCSICGTALPRRMCLACGTANDIEAFRCVECGEALRPTAAPAPAPEVESGTRQGLGPLARLAELSARAASSPVPGPPAEAACTTPSPTRPPPQPAAAILPDLAATMAAVAQAATEPLPASPSPTPTAPFSSTLAQSTSRTTRPAAGPGEAAAVDLYLELPRSGAPARDDARVPLPVAEMSAAAATSPSTTMPGTTLEVDVPFEPMPPAAAAAAAAAAAGPHRLIRLAPYAIGLAAVGIGIVVSGDGWLISRSSPARETAPPARAAQDPQPARPGLPASDDVRPAGQPLPSALTTRPPDRTVTAASAAAPQRGPGVDAAADAALAAAERALAAPAGQPSASTSPTARPRAAAAPSSGASAPPTGTASGR